MMPFVDPYQQYWNCVQEVMIYRKVGENFDRTYRDLTSVMSDGQRILDVIEVGRAYDPTRLAGQLGIRTSAVRAWLEQRVSAGTLEQGLFQNADGGRLRYRLVQRPILTPRRCTRAARGRPTIR
ncbi:hypothetical protein [Burkholderia cepacia]|uniref:hypothetical protein n=1 Tax=Burkholderia cepacia TaxID=292 RepID=UPI0012D8D3A0|nr:hypothetical protein [Burkholderia cepacia]